SEAAQKVDRLRRQVRRSAAVSNAAAGPAGPGRKLASTIRETTGKESARSCKRDKKESFDLEEQLWVDKKDPGYTTRDADRCAPQGGDRSAAWDVYPGVPPSPSVSPSVARNAGHGCIPGSRAQRLGSRSDRSSTAKLPLEWPTQYHLVQRG